jgi:tetratricopeptide (TPR) repeat protein
MAVVGSNSWHDPAHSFYLSSPLLGLARERGLAQRLISERQQACRHSYEASCEPPVASCQADVRSCEHYVLILAGRYGTALPDYDDKSVTELEFEAALVGGLTLHAFFLNYISDLQNGIDDDAGRIRLAAFKNRVQQHCRAKVCSHEEEFNDALKLLAAHPPARPSSSAIDPTLGADSTPHNLPFRARQGDGLIGREEALSRLAQLLERGDSPVVITGMDGVGKTALALHHLRRNLERYRGGVVVLDGQLTLAEMVEQLELFVRARFGQEVPPTLPLAGQLSWLYRRWSGSEPVLLLVDELRDPQDLEALGQGIPERFQILVTSRRQIGVASQRVSLEPLAANDAVLLLEQLAERGAWGGMARQQSLALAQAVGGLPLALHLLGRQLARDKDLELTDLERRLRRRGALAQELQGASGDLQVVRGLRAGFLLAWEQLSTAERELGLLLGELPAAAVPWDLLEPCCPGSLSRHLWDEARLELQGQHLLERRRPRLYALHPLLHDLFAAEASQQTLEERAMRQERLAKALTIWLKGISDVLEARTLEASQDCLPLLEALTAWPAERSGESNEGLACLALGRLRSGLGTYKLAVEALQAGKEQAQASEGDRADEVVAGCLVALAGIAREQGALAKAEQQCREALTLLGEERSEPGAKPSELALARADALNGLGLVLHELGHPEAEDVLRQALELRSLGLEEDDRRLQVSRNNLARTLAGQGRLAEAEALYRTVLAALADDPCEVGMAVHNNMAFLAMAQGLLEHAFAELMEAVHLAEQSLGERHPRRGELLKNLAIVAEQLGQHQEAEAYYREALELVSAAWGPEDPRSQDCQLTLEAFLAEKKL